ncbi:hypothetical protein [Zhongshania sp.]|uniref:hypothetical protein n=1 Tax=Zhongshania sp. TaxID=1971902 RepID=UPI002A80DBE7|nr:hypothetical protein [Zhongshania sp.]
MSLSSIVKIFRLSEKPTINNGRIVASVSSSPELIAALGAARTEFPGNFEEVIIDGDELLSGEALPTQALNIEYTFVLPTSSEDKFYSSVSELINSASCVSKGRLPSTFYLLDDDFYNFENESNSEIASLKSVCDLIRALVELAHYHDVRTALIDCYNLVFLNSSESGKNSTFVLKTKISPDFLGVDPMDLSIIRVLVSDDSGNDPHFTAKKGVFISSMSEFLSNVSDPEMAFSKLVKEWDNFLYTYKKNLETYLSGFAFHKAKREVAEAEVEIASQFSKIVGDITGKLFAIPLSFAAVIAFSKATDTLDKALVFVGLLISSLIIYGVVSNQKRQLERITHAKDIVLGSFRGNADIYPADLSDAITNMKDNLDKNESKLNSTLGYFMFLAWVPVIFILGIIFIPPDVLGFAVSLLEKLLDLAVQLLTELQEGRVRAP